MSVTITKIIQALWKSINGSTLRNRPFILASISRDKETPLISVISGAQV
jgi:hypothetical protein